MPTFTDTSALYALLSPPDRHHEQATDVARHLVREREPLWTIDAVVIELWRLSRGSRGNKAADAALQALVRQGLEIQPSVREDYTRAWQFALEWPDQDFALVDRLAFGAMERLRLYRAWSYDADFAVIRLGPTRNRALDLLR